MKVTVTQAPDQRLNPPRTATPPDQYGTGKPLQQVELKPEGTK